VKAIFLKTCSWDAENAVSANVEMSVNDALFFAQSLMKAVQDAHNSKEKRLQVHLGVVHHEMLEE
jgi:hypothetical protein